jgi:hypothetical protein
MDRDIIRNKVSVIQNQREFLVRLLDRPNLGTLRLDVTQALEELDELIEEFDLTFPGERA